MGAPAVLSPGAAAVRRVYQHVAHLLHGVAPAERAAYLEMGARRIGANALADEIARRHPDRPWSVPWARWREASEHFVAAEDQEAAGLVDESAPITKLIKRPHAKLRLVVLGAAVFVVGTHTGTVLAARARAAVPARA